MIMPTVGRVVWYRPWGSTRASNDQPQAAIISYVHSDTCVNLAIFNVSGTTDAQTSVPLYQGEGERPLSAYCEWMPYQMGQAAKTEQLEKKLTESEQK